MECLVCDWPECTLAELLGRIDNDDLLVCLALDFAERVVPLSPDPRLAAYWLQGARDGVEAALREGQRSGWSDLIASKIWVETMRHAAWAVAEALVVVGSRSQRAEHVGVTAIWAREASRMAEHDTDEECVWQLRHTRRLACTCKALAEAEPDGRRLRNSLLTR
jgi:hypothetical protein